MRYSPMEHREYLTRTLRGPGALFLFLPSYWNLAYLVLPGIHEGPNEEWQPHPIETDILDHTWVGLRDVFDTQYPMVAVCELMSVDMDNPIFRSWDETTYDRMVARAQAAEARLRVGTEGKSGNVVRVNFVNSPKPSAPSPLDR